MSPDIAPALRTAILATSGITTKLATYGGAPAVFTRRPVPDEATYPFIIVSPDVIVSDDDMLSQAITVVTRDIAVYGQNDTPAHYRDVEAVGYAIRALFHRARRSITVSGWRIIDVRCMGPMTAPVDDDKTVGRLVSLTVRLTPS